MNNLLSPLQGFATCKRKKIVLGMICSALLAMSACAPVPASTPAYTPTPAQTPIPKPTPSQKITAATDYLKSLSDDLYQTYSKFRIDDNVADYILFTQSLPKDFQLHVLRERLCIQDRKLTELERQFLKEPDKYLQQMFDSYLSEIGRIDQELATQLKKLPYFKTLEVKDVEAIEDFLWLASIPKYKPTLEKIYGKGIQRKMHSVTLEALLWRAYTRDYDDYNPLEHPDYSKIFPKLAEFQEKYNQQMDETESLTGKKPQTLGMGYFHEPHGYMQKSADDVRFDYALMRWVLGVNAVRIWGYTDLSFRHVGGAHEEGLEVWLQYSPLYTYEKDNIDLATYSKWLSDFAKKAQESKAEVLIVGNEIELHSNKLTKSDLQTNVNELIKVARQNYRGKVTYCDYQGYSINKLNWESMDVVFPQLYKGTGTKSSTEQEYVSAISHWKEAHPSKPFVIAEIGCLTIANGELWGGWWDEPFKRTPKPLHDPVAQAESIDRQIRINFQAEADGLFLHVWDEPASGQEYDKNKFGYGIWDYITMEPKPAFWSVYKYYKER